MAFRDAQLREYCFICKERASSACKRCSRPLCSDHEPIDEGQRCASCESEYYSTPGRLADAADRTELFGELTALASIPAVTTLAVVGLTAAALGVGVVATGILGFLLFKSHRDRAARKKYLAAGKERRLLGEGERGSDSSKAE
jgi:hypothetical protein